MDVSGSLKDYGSDIYRRDKYQCQYCELDGKTFENWLNLTIDHVIPKAQGGSENASNKVTACRACNTFENRAHIDNFEQKKKLILAKREENRQWWESNVKNA